jgi:hypothetical protein
VENLSKIMCVDIGAHESRGAHRGSLFMPPSPCCGRPDTDGGPMRDLMEPWTQRVVHPERAGPAHEVQKGCLERVVSVVGIAEDRSANAEYHWSVPLDQGSEGELGAFAAPLLEPLQQLTVGQAADGAQVEERAEMPESRGVLTARHRSGLWQVLVPSTMSNVGGRAG